MASSWGHRGTESSTVTARSAFATSGRTALRARVIRTRAEGSRRSRSASCGRARLRELPGRGRLWCGWPGRAHRSSKHAVRKRPVSRPEVRAIQVGARGVPCPRGAMRPSR